MRIGIFAKTFVRPTLSETLDAVVAHGIDCIQFNFACAGLPSMPEKISPELVGQIQRELQQRSLSMGAVSGTFNMIHPDVAQRHDGLNRLAAMAGVCSILRTSLITLCTGTRDAENMWRHHPANDSEEAWKDLRTSILEALEIAERFQVTLGVEPETANVISSARKARRLLDEIKSPRLKIVFDAANFFHMGELTHQREILDEAFDLLGNDIVLAHAKDVREENGEMKHVAAGRGDLDWDYYLSKLREANPSAAVVLHGLEEREVNESVAFLRGKLDQTRQRDARASGVPR